MLLLLCALALAGSKADLDAKYGFRDVKFESAPFEGATLVEDSGTFKCYQRPSDDLKVGNVVLKELVYCYYKDALATVFISTEGYSNSRGFLDVLTAAYGEGYQSNRYIERYYWFGSRVTLSYNENSSTNNAQIMMSSSIVAKKKEADDKEAAKAASEGL